MRGLLSALMLCGLVACGSSGGPAVQPVHAFDPDAESLHVQGTIAEIRFQNINKAQGHYTYNVELIVEHDAIGTRPAGQVQVRVQRVYWSRLSEADQSALAPDGPLHVLHPTRWRGYAVGATFDDHVVLHGPSSGVLR